jgi:hypothetical protein
MHAGIFLGILSLMVALGLGMIGLMFVAVAASGLDELDLDEAEVDAHSTIEAPR